MSQHHELIKNKPEWKAARQACLERDAWTCVNCEATEGLEVDHIIPLSVVLADEATAYLATDLDNLQTLCGPCNKAKAAKQENVIVRQAWVNPSYAELIPILRGEPEDPRTLAFSQNRAEKIREG